MREIKFRVWDSTNNRMVGIVDFDTLWFNKNELSRFDDVIAQPFTGLKDKNGKEIYMGDVIQQRFQPNQNIKKYKYDKGYIVYMQNHACFGIQWDEGDWTLNLTEFDGRVIGNIYENPELLSCE